MITDSIKEKDIKRDWYLADAKGKTLGRLATRIAIILMGKEKTNFVYNLDCGDWVVVTNCERVEVTGRKETDKLYQHHTGWPGGLREITYRKMMEKDPRRAIYKAVSGMLPKNKLRAKRLKRLRIFVGDKHSHGGKVLIDLK